MTEEDLIQMQRGQAQLVMRGVGEATGPALPAPPPPAAQPKQASSVPWWVWAVLAGGALYLWTSNDSPRKA